MINSVSPSAFRSVDYVMEKVSSALSFLQSAQPVTETRSVALAGLALGMAGVATSAYLYRAKPCAVQERCDKALVVLEPSSQAPEQLAAEPVAEPVAEPEPVAAVVLAQETAPTLATTPTSAALPTSATVPAPAKPLTRSTAQIERVKAAKANIAAQKRDSAKGVRLEKNSLQKARVQQKADNLEASRRAVARVKYRTSEVSHWKV